MVDGARLYMLLAEEAGPGTRSLETGSGLSTVLLAALGAQHTCVTPSLAEAQRIEAFCVDRGIDTSSLAFRIGASDEVLPGLCDQPPLDLVFIDGGHGYPTPMIDWYYTGGRLRTDGCSCSTTLRCRPWPNSVRSSTPIHGSPPIGALRNGRRTGAPTTAASDRTGSNNPSSQLHPSIGGTSQCAHCERRNAR